MDKENLILTLQSNLMDLAKAFVDKKGNKPWIDEIEEFNIYHNQFKNLIGNLPSDFYLEEKNSNYSDEILKLSEKIKTKIKNIHDRI